MSIILVTTNRNPAKPHLSHAQAHNSRFKTPNQGRNFSLMFRRRRAPGHFPVPARGDHEPGESPQRRQPANENASSICRPAPVGGGGHPLDRPRPAPAAAGPPPPARASGPPAPAAP